MEFDFFIGIDVSKDELDFAVRSTERFLYHREIANRPEAIGAFIKELRKEPGFELSRAVFCMSIQVFIITIRWPAFINIKRMFVLEAATQIKNSLGNIRGKNDKIDAKRIAQYAYDQQKKLSLWRPKREAIQELSNLLATRSRLISVKKQLKSPLKEHGLFSSKRIARQNVEICAHALKAIEADLARADKAIEKIIKADPELNRLFHLVTSVSGIGKVTATQILVTTNEFKDIKDPKKFACYSGVVPFTDDSGKLKKKARISHMANKKVKTLLHMSALVAIQYNADLKRYYERMVGLEKKNKMSVINAVRNKLILRIFACVNQNRPYEINYQKTLA